PPTPTLFPYTTLFRSSSWNQSALQPRLDGAIGFYGRPPRTEPYIAKMKAPLLLLVAGADGATPPEVADDFDQKLTEAGVPHERQDRKSTRLNSSHLVI